MSKTDSHTTDPTPEQFFDHNEHGWWCPNCGHCVRSIHTVFNPDDDPDPPLPSECNACGFPEVSEEWIEANV